MGLHDIRITSQTLNPLRHAAPYASQYITTKHN